MTESMSEEAAPRRGVSWELMGILAVLAVFLVMFLIWAFAPNDESGIVIPDLMTLGSDLGLTAGTTEEGRPYLGEADAPSIIYEFADFQCAGCAEFANELSHDIFEEYLTDGTARLVWVNLPLAGEGSEQAAKAAICATDEGQFWDLYDTLFLNQGTSPLDREAIGDIVEAVGLDWGTIEECMDSEETALRLRVDQELAADRGITSTPSFVVGDEIVVGTDMDKLREVLDSVAEM